MDRVFAVTDIERHMKRTKSSTIFSVDLLWLKFWIKDTFIRYEVDNERIILWKESFPEVNEQWKEVDKNFNIVHWALCNNFDFLVKLNSFYWKGRHAIKEFLISRKIK